MAARMIAVVLIAGVFIGICLFEFQIGRQAVAHVEWPNDPDVCRDISVAQTFLNHEPDADNAYLNERQWYNPLFPSLIALAAYITETPIYLVYIHGGAYISLLIPLIVLLFVYKFFDPKVAIATVFAMEFLVRSDVCGYRYQLHHYQPTIFTTMFGQLFLYIGWGLCLGILTHKGKLLPILLSAVWLGITFLLHTAHALQLGTALAIVILWPELMARFSWRELTVCPKLQRCATLAACLGIAFLISWPYAENILFHYHLNIRNSAPGNWVAAPVDLASLPRLMLSYITPVSILTAIGAWYLLHASPQKPYRRSLLLLWTAIATCWILAGYLIQGINLFRGVRGLSLPVPTIHFFITLKFVESLLCGYGLVVVFGAIGSYIAGRVAKCSRFAGELSLFALSAVILLFMWTPYARHGQMHAEHPEHEAANAIEEKALYDFLRRNVSTSTVVLARPHTALYSVVPSGAKTVVVPQYHSNPYVEWNERNSDMAIMYRSLSGKDRATFNRLATKYCVAYVVLEGDEKSWFDHQDFEPVFESKRYLVGKRTLGRVAAPTDLSNTVN